jgi:hypothetical protein
MAALARSPQLEVAFAGAVEDCIPQVFLPFSSLTTTQLGHSIAPFRIGPSNVACVHPELEHSLKASIL